MHYVFRVIKNDKVSKEKFFIQADIRESTISKRMNWLIIDTSIILKYHKMHIVPRTDDKERPKNRMLIPRLLRDLFVEIRLQKRWERRYKAERYRGGRYKSLKRYSALDIDCLRRERVLLSLVKHERVTSSSATIDLLLRDHRNASRHQWHLYGNHADWFIPPILTIFWINKSKFFVHFLIRKT